MAKVSLIVAMSRNRVIGAQNKLPWNIPEDLKRFREITTGHPIIMGRKTFDSIGRPLPKRTNIVITRDSKRTIEGCLVVDSLERAIAEASAAGIPGSDEVFVIGGGEIYRQALPRADRLYLTLVDCEIEGDAFFPEISWVGYREISRERRKPEEGAAFEFLVLERKS